MKLSDLKHNIFRWLALFLIITCSVFYSLYLQKFAEIHISLSFLSFPIFIGEILLAVCIVCYIVDHRLNKIKFGLWDGIAIFFLACLLFKAIPGYMHYGALSFRNAALFYYALFFVPGLYFFERPLFGQPVLLFLLVGILLISQFIFIQTYFKFVYAAVFIVLVLQVKPQWLKFLFLGLFILIFPFKNLLMGPRAHVLGVLLATVYILYIVVFVFNNPFKKYRLVIFLLAIISIIVGIKKFCDKGKIKSFLNFSNLTRIYYEKEDELRQKEKTFKEKDLKPQLYSQDDSQISSAAVYQSSEVEQRLENLKPVNSREEKNRDQESPKIQNTYEVRQSLKRETSQLVSKPEKPAPSTVPISSSSQRENPREVIKDSQVLQKEDISSLVNRLYIDAHVNTIKEAFDELEVGENEIINNYQIKLRNNKINNAEAMAQANDEINKLISEIIEKKEAKVLDIISKQLVAQGYDKAAVLSKIYPENKAKNAAVMKEKLRSVANVGVSRTLGFVDERSVDVEQGNMLFRYYIWRDMLRDMKKDKAILGVNMGKPQRSRSIEILGWAIEEWTRDGWITPHNSFLHMVYRAGILGFIFVIFIFYGLVDLTKKFITAQSVEGIVLVAALIYSAFIAFFLVFLELPQYAIPFWSLYGLTFGYSQYLITKSSQKR